MKQGLRLLLPVKFDGISISDIKNNNRKLR